LYLRALIAEKGAGKIVEGKAFAQASGGGSGASFCCGVATNLGEVKP